MARLARCSDVAYRSPPRPPCPRSLARDRLADLQRRRRLGVATVEPAQHGCASVPVTDTPLSDMQLTNAASVAALIVRRSATTPRPAQTRAGLDRRCECRVGTRVTAESKPTRAARSTEPARRAAEGRQSARHCRANACPGRTTAPELHARAGTLGTARTPRRHPLPARSRGSRGRHARRGVSTKRPAGSCPHRYTPQERGRRRWRPLPIAERGCGCGLTSATCRRARGCSRTPHHSGACSSHRTRHRRIPPPIRRRLRSRFAPRTHPPMTALRE